MLRDPMRDLFLEVPRRKQSPRNLRITEEDARPSRLLPAGQLQRLGGTPSSCEVILQRKTSELVIGCSSIALPEVVHGCSLKNKLDT